ncbi:MAG TPA: hypothetical protein EYG17_00545 [Acidimicrobiia bacterium]|jgi:hypothetical protein|nr:hypothetical protein [Acidimicrobiia bacterium]HIL04522.1 hypothetical protein [Acidimicrobiia bacterium]
MRTAVYPGSFNPPTVAHLEISQAVRIHCHIDNIVWSVSQIALGKEGVTTPRFQDRLTILDEVASEYDWLQVVVTNAQLFADIALGYDLVVMGADKWHQIQDPAFYDDDPVLRDEALSNLPQVAIAPREPFDAPADLVLPIPENLLSVSSTEARAGMTSLMLEPARRFDELSGAWTDPERYETWLTQNK